MRDEAHRIRISVYIGWWKVVADFCSSAGKKDSHKTRLLVKHADLWVCKNVASTRISVRAYPVRLEFVVCRLQDMNFALTIENENGDVTITPFLGKSCSWA